MITRAVSVMVAATAAIGIGVMVAPAASAYSSGSMITQSQSACRAEEKRFRDEGYIITSACMQYANGWAFWWYDPRP